MSFDERCDAYYNSISALGFSRLCPRLVARPL